MSEPATHVPNLGGPLILNERDRSVVDRIVAPARPQEKRGQIVHEGYRFVAFGETGSGKTSLERVVLYYTIAEGLANCAFIHDTKGIFPEYPRSIQLPTVEHFKARGFRDGDVPIVSFRGDPRADLVCSAETVGAFCKGIGQRGQTLPNGQWGPYSVVMVVEELAAASMPGRKNLAAPSVLWGLEQGRKVGVSVIGTTQSPRKVPLDFFGQVSSTAYFRLTGSDANYLGDVLELDPALVQTLRGPTGEGLPRYKFCLSVKGESWDGQIYSLDKRTALMFE